MIIVDDEPLAFDTKQDGTSAGPVAPTLKAMQHADSHINGGGQIGVVTATGEVYTHTLDAGDGSATEDGRGRGNPVVAIFGDMTHTLTGEGADASEDGTGRGTPVVAVPVVDVMPTLQAGGNETGGIRPPGTTVDTVMTLMVGASRVAKYIVRRLAPTECERLQGFDDDHTRWGAKGEEISDSQRYKMCGNAVSVPVGNYVGALIQHVDERVFG